MPVLGSSLFYLYPKPKFSVQIQRRQEGKIATRINEVLANIPLVQAFNREKYEEGRFDRETAQILEQGLRISRLEAASTRAAAIVTDLGVASALFFGALQVLKGRMMPGHLILFSSYLNNLYKPVRNLANFSTDFSRAMVARDRIAEILDTEPEVQDDPEALEAPPLRGELVFENVTFAYGNEKPALRNVSFSLASGQKLALIGASGAGKSTVASLLLRLYDPQQGSVRIDGVDIKKFRRESLRRQIGIVLQNSVLFGATIRENISYGPGTVMGATGCAVDALLDQFSVTAVG